MIYDVAIIGAGILGLAHALAAARLGKRVIVIERDSVANGASVRNFGFVTVTGQRSGDCWALARRSRDVWQDVADEAGIPILHRGLVVAARRPESEAVIDAFLQTEMGEGCRRLTPKEARDHIPALRTETVTAALYSPHELRVESRDVLPVLAAWLESRHDVTFSWRTSVNAVDAPLLETSRGPIHAETVIVCPGDDVATLYPQRLEAYGVTRCKLQMLRLKPDRQETLRAALMSDLGLAHYHGYADLPEAAALKDLLDEEQKEHRANGVHLIAVQSADGTLVVGDSHSYETTPDPFIDTDINGLILGEVGTVLDLGAYSISETWAGTYAWAPDRWRLTDAPDAATRIVVVTAGCGASTAFGIGEETMADLYSQAGVS